MLLGLFGLTNVSAQVSDYQADENYPLILGVEQFSSPCEDTGEGSFWALLGMDAGDNSSHSYKNDFWHSNWRNGSQPGDSHYFQVEMLTMEEWNEVAPESELPDYIGMLDDMVEYPSHIVFVFTRRPTDNDHTIKWIVRGTNDPNAEKDACEVLATIETPFSNNSETLTSDTFQHKGYRYLRFYSAEQHPSKCSPLLRRMKSKQLSSC